MIEVRYSPADYRLSIRGHAGYAEAGKDIVCAAASALTYTLAMNIDALSHVYARRKTVRLSEGDSEISCVPVHGMRNVVRLIFEVVIMGYQALAEKYPENVTIIRDTKKA